MTDPVGWIYEDDEGRMMFSQMPQNPPFWEPVYRARKQWQGLTDEDFPAMRDGDHSFYSGMFWAEAKLKEKNA